MHINNFNEVSIQVSKFIMLLMQIQVFYKHMTLYGYATIDKANMSVWSGAYERCEAVRRRSNSSSKFTTA